MPRRKKCPKCGQAAAVVPIMYGMPPYEMFEKAERGELVFAGCMVGDVDPRWHCRSCRIDFDFSRPELAGSADAERGWIERADVEDESTSGQTSPGKRLERLAEFLPLFESSEFSFGKWGGGEKTESGVMQMPYFAFSDDAHRFIKAAYELGFVREDLDWPSWKDTPEARKLLEPRSLEQATVDDLEHLLTTLIRQDRFVEGELAGAYESGLLTRILRRTRQLADEMQGSLI